jgi:ketosteroid isomerase-like protein
MKKTVFVVLMMLTVLAPALAQPDASGTETDQAIAHLREGLVDSFNHGDIDRLLTFLDTNAVVTWQNGEVCEGTAAVKDYYNRMMKGDQAVVSKVTSDPKVLGRHMQGDWEVAWGELNDHFILTDGRDLPLNSRFTATVAKRGDQWKVAAFHVSVNAFHNPVLTLAVRRVALIGGIGGIITGLILGILGAGLFRGSKKTP